MGVPLCQSSGPKRSPRAECRLQELQHWKWRVSLQHSSAKRTLLTQRRLPGNDDSGAMGALLIFHLLGLYPVPSSKQLLLGSPFFSSYTIRNPLFGTSTTVKVNGFDKATLVASPPAGSRLYVQSVTINGVSHDSLCWISWDDIVGGGEIVLEVGPTVPSTGCGTSSNALPSSLETGGF